jgi:serine/threonine-protein kinase RsbW
VAEYELTYRSVPEAEAVMENDLSRLLEEHEVDGEAGYRITLAVSEAFTNALIHGNRRDPDKHIKIHLEINEKAIRADIVDEGRGGLGEIQERKPPELLGEHGRGIDLIEYYGDSVSFTELDTGGLKVSVAVRRKRKHGVEQ